ncbi:MAG: zinc metallopeptidase [Paludibacteraceae bacterium]|nr:zinc metallopeptidase [Paludibacteraceae bacterium]
MIYWIIFGAIAILSIVVQQVLKAKFNKYSKVSLPMTGRQVAEKMLRDNGITDVTVISTDGQLTDHYNPTNKTINLSEGVCDSATVAAAAVAAHECGHAIQHADQYAPLSFRSKMVPVLSVTNRWMSWILLAGMLLLNYTPIPLAFGVVLFGLTTLFSFITLPVEVDASRRAVKWLEDTGITNRQTTEMASDALHWAAYTYVVAALASLANLLYYVFLLLGRRD